MKLVQIYTGITQQGYCAKLGCSRMMTENTNMALMGTPPLRHSKSSKVAKKCPHVMNNEY